MISDRFSRFEDKKQKIRIARRKSCYSNDRGTLNKKLIKFEDVVLESDYEYIQYVKR